MARSPPPRQYSWPHSVDLCQRIPSDRKRTREAEPAACEVILYHFNLKPVPSVDLVWHGNGKRLTLFGHPTLPKREFVSNELTALRLKKSE